MNPKKLKVKIPHLLELRIEQQRGQWKFSILLFSNFSINFYTFPFKISDNKRDMFHPGVHPCASNNNYNYFTNSYAPKPFFPDSRLLHFDNLFGIAYKILYKTFLKTSVLQKHKQPSIFVLYKEIRFLVKIKESYMRSGL